MSNLRYNRGNAYFDTYYVYDDNNNKIGILEDHCRGVKRQYFVGWKNKSQDKETWETKSFYTKDEAINYIVAQ